MKEILGELNHVAGQRAPRLVVLLSSMLLERALDKILAAWMPKYPSVLGNHRMSLGYRILILKALNLVSEELVTRATLVRDIRNKFAHCVAVKRFSDLGDKLVRRLRDQAGPVKAGGPEGLHVSEDLYRFREVVAGLVARLRTAAEALSKINRFLRSGDARTYLTKRLVDRRVLSSLAGEASGAQAGSACTGEGEGTSPDDRVEEEG